MVKGFASFKLFVGIMAVLQSKCLTLSGTTDLPLYPTDLHKLPYELHTCVLRYVCSSQKKVKEICKNNIHI